MPPQLPSGTVTFLFTDIDGSTPLWEREPDALRQGLPGPPALRRRLFGLGLARAAAASSA